MSYDLRLERVYDAAPEVVFDAFTDPDAQKELYADAPDWVVESEIDLRVGGRWTIVFGPPDGPAARETCVFEVVERPRRLVYACHMTMPDGDQLRHRHGGDLRGGGGGRTRLTIVQRGFPTPGPAGRARRRLAQHPRRAGPGRRRPGGDLGVVVSLVGTRAGRREWAGLAVIALPCLLCSMDLTVLNLAVAPDQRGPAAEQRPAAVDRRHLRVPGRRVAGHHGHPRRPDRAAAAAAGRRGRVRGRPRCWRRSPPPPRC